MSFSPYAENKVDSIASLGEKALLRQIRQWLGRAAPPPPRGMGDDAAWLASSGGNVLTSDSLLFRRHFDETVPPEKAGAKLLKRSLSDLAAKGATPGVALLNGAFPGSLSLPWLEGFVRGIAACALTYGVQVVGGDLAETEREIVTSLTLTGQTDRWIPRTGGGPGCSVLVTGELGGSRRAHHLDFIPRLEEGYFLRQTENVVAAIDVTDGLLVDLGAMLPEGCGVDLVSSWIPLREGAGQAEGGARPTALEHALYDGEDHELLFFLSGNEPLEAFQSGWEKAGLARLTRIGILTSDPRNRITIDGEATGALGGYDHFR